MYISSALLSYLWYCGTFLLAQKKGWLHFENQKIMAHHEPAASGVLSLSQHLRKEHGAASMSLMFNRFL